MAVYFVANHKVTDTDLMLDYQAGARDVLAAYSYEAIAVDNDADVLEGSPPGNRVVIIKFDSKEEFHRFYNLAEYQAVIGKRLAATEGGIALLANGFERPA